MCLLEEGQQTIKLLVETESRMWFPGSERGGKWGDVQQGDSFSFVR